MTEKRDYFYVIYDPTGHFPPFSVFSYAAIERRLLRERYYRKLTRNFVAAYGCSTLPMNCHTGMEQIQQNMGLQRSITDFLQCVALFEKRCLQSGEVSMGIERLMERNTDNIFFITQWTLLSL